MTDDDVMIAEMETVLALFLDSDSSGDELEGLRRNNLDVHPKIEQRFLEIQQEFAAALQGREAVTAQQEQSFLQCQESSAPHAQQPAALHAHEAIRNSVFSDLPPFASFLHLKQFQHPAGSYAAPQTHEAIAGAHGSLDGVSSNVPHDLPPTATGPSLKRSIQFQEPAAPQALKSQQTIAAAHKKPKLEPRSCYEFDSYVPPAIPPVPSIQHPIQIRRTASCSR